MIEIQNSDRNVAFAAYKIALKEESPHEINGQKYLAKPLESSVFIKKINNLLSNPSDPYTTIEESLKFTANNSETFCGLSPENYYKNKEEQESIINGAVSELTQMMAVLIENDYKNIVIPQQLKKIFSEIKKPTAENIIKGTRRGMKTAEKCHACEQVDPMVGAMVHTASGILTKIIKTGSNFINSNPDLANLWKDTYFEGSISELSSPKTTGIVDVLIVITERNKEKFPNMDKFFSSNLKLEGFEGTYYDMVNIPEYQ
ncbi:MAG: hypothetical protein WCT51_00325 [Candidatus Shapirobacteria bacterium]|jgi:hypothetical protein